MTPPPATRRPARPLAARLLLLAVASVLALLGLTSPASAETSQAVTDGRADAVAAVGSNADLPGVVLESARLPGPLGGTQRVQANLDQDRR